MNFLFRSIAYNYHKSYLFLAFLSNISIYVFFVVSDYLIELLVFEAIIPGYRA